MMFGGVRKRPVIGQNLPQRINILELHRTINERKERQTECYQRVLYLCHQKIRFVTELKELRCFFNIPEYVVGFPIMDIDSCTKYIISSLNADGFLVYRVAPRTLYISWDFEEIERKSGNHNKENTMIIPPSPTASMALMVSPNNQNRSLPYINTSTRSSNQISSLLSLPTPRQNNNHTVQSVQNMHPFSPSASLLYPMTNNQNLSLTSSLMLNNNNNRNNTTSSIKTITMNDNNISNVKRGRGRPPKTSDNSVALMTTESTRASLSRKADGKLTLNLS